MDKQILRQLYHNLLKEETSIDKISIETKAEIETLLKEFETETNAKEYERYRDELFLAASVAEENGFVKGFIYAFRLFTECAR